MKRSYIFVLFSICFFILCISLYAQSEDDSLLIQWAEFIEEEDNLTEIVEELAENPVNLNTSNREELLQIPLITTDIVDSILVLRSRLGQFTNKSQIRPIMGKELYNLIKEFITIKSKSHHSIIYTHKTYYGIEPIKEIENHTYRGDAFYDYNKICFQWLTKFRIGMVTQKDIGEANYLDYTNGYIEYKSKSIKGIAGSYYCHFGEGLIFSNAYGQQKSSIASLPFRSGKEGGFATLSSSENTSLFGICLNFNHLYGTNIYLLYSKTKRDAQLSNDMHYVTGIDYDGYHRSDGEIKKRDFIDESVLGLAGTHSFFNRFNLGIIYASTRYDPAYEFNSQTAGENAFRLQRYKFSGSEIHQFSTFYTLSLNIIELKGEAASSQKGGSALTQSIFIDKDHINFGIKYWYVSKNFQSPFGKVFDNSSHFPQAEEGYYFGLTINPLNHVTVSTFKIVKKDLWRTYFVEMPKMKDELFTEVIYKPENLSISARLRIKDYEFFLDPESENTVVRKIEQQNIYRLQLDYKPARQYLLKTRWEMTQIQSAKENGSYFFEDLHYYLNSSFSLSARVLFYRTDSYNSRLYEYESDLPGSYANYAVYGEGRSFYLLFKWNIFNKISLLFKYRYNTIIKKDLTTSIARKDNNIIQRTLRFQIKLQL